MADRDAIAAALPAYEIGEELGRGSFGIVLAGRHRQLGREVAIKRLSSALGQDRDIRRRFVQEARMLAGLDHPHVVPIYDFVEEGGLLLLVMERLTGGTLSDRSDRVTPRMACGVMLAACAGLHHAHERGVLHRDVKPDNLMFTAEGTLKVTDFGIAKVVGGSGTVMTQTGSVQGSPAYMAPEQVQSLDVTPATDVYAAGTVLYELLSGNLPYPRASGPLAALYQHLHEDPEPLVVAAPDVPPELAAVVDRAIARVPTDRYDSAELLGEAVAVAATAAWGRGWLEETTVPVLASGRVVAALTRETPVMTMASDRAVSAGEVGETAPGRPAPSRLWAVVAVVAVVVVLAGVGVAMALFGGGGSGKPEPATTTAPPPAGTTATTPPAAGAVPSPAGGGPAPGLVLGRDLAPVRTEPCRAPTIAEGAAWEIGPVQMGGRTYDPAYDCRIFPGGRGSLEFVLGGSFQELKVAIGFADTLSSATAMATFEIIGDDKDYLVPSVTLKFGEVRNLTVDVRQVTRLKLKVTEISVSSGIDSASVPVLAGPTVTRAS